MAVYLSYFDSSYLPENEWGECHSWKFITAKMSIFIKFGAGVCQSKKFKFDMCFCEETKKKDEKN